MSDPTPADLARYEAEPLAFVEDLKISVAGSAHRFSDVMTKYQRLRFKSIMAGMKAVQLGQAPEFPCLWLEETKGNGKDHSCAIGLLWLLTFCPRTLFCQIAAADQDQAAECRRAAIQVCELNPWISEVVKIEAKAFVSLATGARCDIVATDTAGSQGALPDVLVINELSCITKREFVENLMDNATKNPQGFTIVATNAGFLGSWQAAWREIAIESLRWIFHRFAEPAPWLSPEALADARRRNSASRYARLFRGNWAPGGAGDAIDPHDIEVCVTLPGPQGAYVCGAGWDYFAALDIGVKNDRTALAVLGVNWRRRGIRLAYAKSWSPREYGGRVDLGIVEDEILQLTDRFCLHLIYFDPSQALYLASRLMSAGVRMDEYGFTAAHADEMALHLIQAFRNREIELYQHNELIQDLCSMSLVEKTNGVQYKLTAGRDAVQGHADLGFSFAMANSNATRVMTAQRERDNFQEMFTAPVAIVNQSSHPGFIPNDDYEMIRAQRFQE
jgi:hypothetical protein